MNLQAISDKLPAILKKFSTVSLVYGFGSQITGSVGPMSDLDLAYLSD
jgi:hypothetical protein